MLCGAQPVWGTLSFYKLKFYHNISQFSQNNLGELYNNFHIKDFKKLLFIIIKNQLTI